MDKKETDLKWVIELHKQAKAMGLSDEKIKAVARTDGNLHPEAMKEYLAMKNFK